MPDVIQYCELENLLVQSSRVITIINTFIVLLQQLDTQLHIQFVYIPREFNICLGICY